MYNTSKKNVEINGVKYIVKIREYTKRRVVEIMVLNDFRFMHTDTRYKKSGGLFSDPQPLPEYDDHVSDAITEAVSKFENRQSDKDEMSESLDRVLSSAKEVWEDE